nr:MAG TPA: hypothetical protein [Caudoviricetes sp.]
MQFIIANRAEWSSHYYLKQCGFTIIYSQIHFLCESILIKNIEQAHYFCYAILLF